jgi:hypothetical protein
MSHAPIATKLSRHMYRNNPDQKQLFTYKKDLLEWRASKVVDRSLQAVSFGTGSLATMSAVDAIRGTVKKLAYNDYPWSTSHILTDATLETVIPGFFMGISLATVLYCQANAQMANGYIRSIKKEMQELEAKSLQKQNSLPEQKQEKVQTEPKPAAKPLPVAEPLNEKEFQDFFNKMMRESSYPNKTDAKDIQEFIAALGKRCIDDKKKP